MFLTECRRPSIECQFYYNHLRTNDKLFNQNFSTYKQLSIQSTNICSDEFCLHQLWSFLVLLHRLLSEELSRISLMPGTEVLLVRFLYIPRASAIMLAGDEVFAGSNIVLPWKIEKTNINKMKRPISLKIKHIHVSGVVFYLLS